VIASTGGLGGYRWDPGRKKALLAWEQAVADRKWRER
jgi:O6-methylguanine-DNA--protein-cysteine methyltransferase